VLTKYFSGKDGSALLEKRFDPYAYMKMSSDKGSVPDPKISFETPWSCTLANFETHRRLCPNIFQVPVYMPEWAMFRPNVFHGYLVWLYRLRNDLYCVGWGVKLCSIQSKSCVTIIKLTVTGQQYIFGLYVGYSRKKCTKFTHHNCAAVQTCSF